MSEDQKTTEDATSGSADVVAQDGVVLPEEGFDNYLVDPFQNEVDPDDQVLTLSVPIGSRRQLTEAGFPLESFDFGLVRIEVLTGTGDFAGDLILTPDGGVQFNTLEESYDVLDED